jgi:hypothetical protein
MITNKFARFVAAPLAAASILGGAALGLAAGANADPGPSDHSRDYSTEHRDGYRDSDWGGRPDFWSFWSWHHDRDHSFGWHHDH